MNILHVITGLQKAAGTSVFAGEIATWQAVDGHSVSILVKHLTTDHYPISSTVHIYNDVTLSTLTVQPDVVHLHAIWDPWLIKMARHFCRHGAKIVWSTHGMTAPWSLHHKWWKKCLPWHLYQKPYLKRADLIHCTTDLEADWNLALGFSNTFIAPLGTNLPEKRLRLKVEVDNGVKTLLYVGRIYPVKALDNLIKAFAIAIKKRTVHSTTKTTTSNYNWILRIVGPDQAGHMAELMSLCDQLHIPYTTPENASPLHLYTAKNSQCSPRSPWQVEFAGPKFDADLDAEYENCTAFALVSHTENFGVTVVDAMAHGKPVITSTKTPWKIVADRHCGWWTDNDPETLSRTILQLFNFSTLQLSQMGADGRKMVEEQYTWPAIARNLISQYERVIKQ